jgi:imidazole glycerol-phosphate synthase subunit HisH
VSRRPRIAVVDYGAGNLVSIDQALTTVGAEVTVIRDRAGLRDADALIVPGVGAAAPAMARIEAQGLTASIRTWLTGDRPFLGICLGLQLLFERSDEDAATTLGFLRGDTVRLDDAPTLPHIGWNQVERTRPHELFEGIAEAADFYFVHSYAGAPDPNEREVVLAWTQHGGRFVSAVGRGPVLGVQFHPERSGSDGVALLGNFVSIVRAA